MNPWFIWNNKNSLGMGLWVSKLPEIIRPAERVQQVTIPGRAGELTLLEGDEVYDGYVRNITVSCPNENYTEDLLDWLRGSGELIVCTEEQMVYKARIASQVKFSRVGNSLMQGEIPFYCEPFKYARYTESDSFTLVDGITIRNKGNVSSRPKLTAQVQDNLAIALTDTSGSIYSQMSFEHFPNVGVIDCEAGLIVAKALEYNASRYYYEGDYCFYTGSNYDRGLYRFTTEGLGPSTQWEYISGTISGDYEYIWPGKWDGDFLKIKPGVTNVVMFGGAAVTVEPRWRWI